MAYHDPYFTSSDRPARPRPEVKPWVDVIDRYDVRADPVREPAQLRAHLPGAELRRLHPGRRPGDDQPSTCPPGDWGCGRSANTPPFIVKRFADTYGWLALSLHPDGSFAWRYQAVDGTGADAGARPAFPAAAH